VTDVITSDGVRLYAEATGTASGLPVLFIHEFAADHRTWSRQVDALSGTFRCVTYASRGYPPSEVPPEQERYNYLRQADDAIDVLDAFGIARAHVVGLSMGGFCALQLGIRYPDRVSSLLVASAGSGASPAGRAAFLAETEQMAGALRADGMAAVSAKQAMGPNRIQLRRKNAHVWEEFAGQLAEHSAEGMALTVIGIQRSRPSLYDITGQLAGITAPTLVVNGDEDEACLEPGLLLKRTIPTAGLAVVPNSGHALNLEEPELFNDLIRSLIGAAEAGTWPTRDPRSLSASMGIANGAVAAITPTASAVAPTAGSDLCSASSLQLGCALAGEAPLQVCGTRCRVDVGLLFRGPAAFGQVQQVDGGEDGQGCGQPDGQHEQRVGQVDGGQVGDVARGGHDGAVGQPRRDLPEPLRQERERDRAVGHRVADEHQHQGSQPGPRQSRDGLACGHERHERQRPENPHPG